MRTFGLFLCAVVCGASVLPDRSYHPDNVEQAGRATRIFGSVNPAELTAEYWAEEALQGIRAHEARTGGAGPVAKNLVMFLGDGMSVPTLAAARTLLGQLANRTGEEAQLYFEGFPTVGLAKTYCVNQQIADSACTATAYLCGVKNNYGTLGVTAAVPRRNCSAYLDPATHLQSIAAWALDEGKDVGIVTTTRITHASPAGTFARSANRNWENDVEVAEDGYSVEQCPDIAHQLVHGEPGNRFKVILGGGRREFMPTTATGETGGTGYRTDGRDLVEEWKAQKASRNQTHSFVYDRATLDAAMAEEPEYLFGLFHNGHMRYSALAPASQPTLAELTQVAVRMLSRNERGFFLFVEGGRIDHAHHDGQPLLALTETIAFSEAVEAGSSLLGDDALVVVTSDHSHVMGLAGYTQRGSDILGASDNSDEHGVPYMTLSYINGPGFRAHVNGSRVNVLHDDNFMDAEWVTHADVPLEEETHGGDDVAVFARGPQHAAFSGLYEQSRIPRLMAYAGCIGPGPRAPACSAGVAFKPLIPLLIVMLLFITRA